MAYRGVIRRLPALHKLMLPELFPRRLASQDCEVRKDKCVRYECRQSEPYNVCKSLTECGPCSKHKYMDVRCKVAIVTGGACGIGFSTANELLCQEAYRVVIADVNKKQGMKAKEVLEKVHGKDRVCFVQLDVNNGEHFKNIFRKAHEVFGGVDILVNNASVLTDLKWEFAVDTNLKSVLRGVLLGFEWMAKEKKSMKGGVVVNVSSTAGLDPDPHAPLLTAAKHGVVGLTKSIGGAVHFRRTGVRVVGLCPGPTKASQPEDNKDLSPELQQAYFDVKTPRQSPEKVAKAVNYLIRYAPSGSIWVAEDSQLFKAIIPNRKTFSDPVDVV